MDTVRELKLALLREMRRPGYRPLAMNDLQRRLGIKGARRGQFKRAFQALLDEGAIERVDRRHYAATAPQGVREAPGAAAGSWARAAGRTRAGMSARPQRGAAHAERSSGGAGPLLTGLLQVNPRGFAFVVPERGGRDLFIPPHAVGGRRDGDRVEARVTRESPDGRLQGEVVRLVERSGRRVVGVFRTTGEGGGVVDAWDRRFEGGIVIRAEDVGGAVNGLVVGVDLVQGAEEGRPAVGRVVEVIGPPEAPETDLRAVILKYGLREQFPPDVLDQAGRTPPEVGPADLAGREDFRGLPIVTIDGETAMDFDDAVLVRRDDAGWELQVHIADVAHYVPPGSPLDREAFARATSVYFPGTSLPMLPHRLSNGICSLNPNVDRLVLSCLMRVDAHGQVVSHDLVEGVIRSAARMTYTNVAKILVDHDAGVMARYRDLVPQFLLMQELCGILNARRRRRGSIDFDLPEPEVILAATGEMTGILALERNIAHRIIEEFMLAANETVARHLWKARMPSIYRVHERPDPRRLEDFDATARAFGYTLPRPFTAIEPGSFQALLDRARGRPEERFLATLMLRSMKQARYSEKRDIHFGLASSCYTHFTSPIRRYPDLVVHRLVKRLLRGGPLSPAERGRLEESLPDAAGRSSFRERAADSAENELIERKKMAFMADRLGEEYPGFVCGVESSGLLVELDDLFVEGLVPIATLPGDRYRFDERRRLLRGERGGRTFALGDPVRVRVDHVDAARLEIDFSLLEARTGPRPAGVTPPRRPSRGAPPRPRRSAGRGHRGRGGAAAGSSGPARRRRGRR